MGMLAIDLRLGSHLSPRNVPIDGSTGYSCPILQGEPELQRLQRRMIVILAGIAWEVFSSPGRNLLAILRSQRDDSLAAFRIGRELLKRHRLGRLERRQWLSQAWERANAILSLNNNAIIKVGEMLSAIQIMDDSTLRFLVASATRENTANPGTPTPSTGS
jgi:hypothetical protein